MADLLTTLHPINDNNTDLYPNVKNENLPPVISGKDAMEALEGEFSTLKTDEIQVGGENGTLINKDQIVTQSKVINLNEIVDDAELAQGLNGKVDKVSGKGLSTNDFTNEDKALVATIPNKVNKEQGKGLSTNDFTNADKIALELTIPSELSSLRAHIFKLYRMVIRSGDMITVTDASVALASQPFPLTVSPKALLNYIGGMCQKIGNSIITAPVTMMLSKGFNLWDEEWEVGGINSTYGTDYSTNTRIRSKNYCGCLPNTTYYFYCGGNQEVGIAWYDKDKNFVSWDYSNTNGTKTSPSNARYFRIQKYDGYGTTYNHDICINISNASMNGIYKPYSAPIYYPIHPDIQSLDGYGWGINADCYNYIDLERKVFVKKVARVDLGSLNWTYDSENQIFYTAVNVLPNAKLPNAWNTVVSNILSPKYTATKGNPGAGYISLENDGRLRVGTTDSPTGYLYYELATPVETDISNLLVLTFPTYDIINVLPGGYLEFENENDIGVPYSVTYQSKPNAQTPVLTTAQPTISEVDSNDPTDTL